MILYFSATGNSKYVATRIAEIIHDEMREITDCITDSSFLFEDEWIGIVTPTYFWGLPSIVNDFLKKSEFHTDYLYFVATYGTTPGAIGALAKEAISNRKVDALYSVRMVDTYTPIFDISTPEKQNAFTANTETEIQTIIGSINEKLCNKQMIHSTPAFVVKGIAQPIYNRKARRTSRLSVDANCIGCGLCEKKCPVQAIQMKEGRPVWVKEKCVMCLGCLHRCPKFSIQCGNKTRKHGQYTNPNVKI